MSQDTLDDVWKQTEHDPPYPQSRMKHLMDVIGMLYHKNKIFYKLFFFSLIKTFMNLKYCIIFDCTAIIFIHEGKVLIIGNFNITSPD